MKFIVLALAMGSASAFAPMRAPNARTAVQMSAAEDGAKATAAAMAAALALGAAAPPAQAITAAERAQLSYLQVKGTGLANRCSTAVGGDNLEVKQGAQIVDLCLEPKAFFVEESVQTKQGVTKTEFVSTKLMTRQTYTLDGISGPLSVNGGKIQFDEADGIDYAATTVQLPGGDRVPFLFTVKDLVAKGAKDGSSFKPGYEFGGKFVVPSYRTGLFLDPKGRGMATGYDMAQALPALQSGEEEAELFNENNKKFDVLDGSIEFEVQAVNKDESEMSGVFVSAQPSDTDMGGKEAKKLLLKGVFYAKVDQ